MTKTWHICVLIPACNEEKLLPRCLKSVLDACARIPFPNTFDIVLIVDSSTDNTLKLGQEILNQQGAVLNIMTRNVGAARNFAAATALKRYKGPLTQCWLANTDADCEVPTHWLIEQLKWASLGMQSIAGIVTVDSYIEHKADVPYKFLKDYVIHPDGTHPHVHGANLGIRADTYLNVGGWRPLETAEDHDLWNRLAALEIPKISDAKLFVITSGRKIGRAPRGFANKLASYNGDLNE